MATQYEKRKIKTIKESDDEPVNYDSIGYDIFYDDDIKKYVRVNIEYDSKTGAARVKDRKEIGDSQPVATRKMSELFTRKILKLPFD